MYEAGHGLQEMARNQKKLKDDNRRFIFCSHFYSIHIYNFIRLQLCAFFIAAPSARIAVLNALFFQFFSVVQTECGGGAVQQQAQHGVGRQRHSDASLREAQKGSRCVLVLHESHFVTSIIVCALCFDEILKMKLIFSSLFIFRQACGLLLSGVFPADRSAECECFASVPIEGIRGTSGGTRERKHQNTICYEEPGKRVVYIFN